MKVVNIAIDGPSGAGKSTLAQNLADKLGFAYVDTGALYRGIGLYLYRAGIDCADRERVVAALPNIHVAVAHTDGAQRTLLGDEDVTDAIRAHTISECASKVSAHGEVRAHLLDLQRSIAASRNCLLDGRDIGTVVLPKADLKIFLTASEEERATRRYQELKEKGQDVSFETVLRDIRVRDGRDRSREAAPLRPAEDSVHLNSDGLTAAQTMARALEIVEEHLGQIAMFSESG